jgi:hypothetical protein
LKEKCLTSRGTCNNFFIFFILQNLKDTAEQFTQLEHDYQKTVQKLEEKQSHFDHLQQVSFV